MELKHKKYAICAIASPLEKNYIDEWIAYHKKIGIEFFFIATNDWEWTPDDPFVAVTRADGREQQIKYYTWYVNHFSRFVDWTAFIDCDEFIKLGAKHKSIDDLIEEHKFETAIALSWRMFGSSGLHYNGENSVLKRFTHRQKGFNQHIKTILNTRKLASFGEDRLTFFANPHFPMSKTITGIHTYSVDGRRVEGPYDKLADIHLKDEDPWLAHFFCKTPEEWKQKKERGRIDVPATSPILYRKDEEFAENDLNDVEDTTLRDTLYGESHE